MKTLFPASGSAPRSSSLSPTSATAAGLRAEYVAPVVIRQAGSQLGDTLAFLLVLNAGAIVGSISASVLADRSASAES